MRPYKYVSVNRLKILAEVLFTTIFFVMIVYLQGKQYLSINFYKNVGWVLTYLMIIFIITEILVLFISKKQLAKVGTEKQKLISKQENLVILDEKIKDKKQKVISSKK